MKVLAIHSSISGDASITRALATDFIEELVANRPEIIIAERDLACTPVPHLGTGMAAVQLGATTPDVSGQREVSDALIAELESCDLLLLGAPMYNFGMPSTLKAWFDQVIRVGRTFSYVDGSPRGLLPKGKKAVVFVAAGGTYSSVAGERINFLEPHVRWLLNFVGIQVVEFVCAEGLAFGPEVSSAAIAVARARAKDVARNHLE